MSGLAAFSHSQARHLDITVSRGLGGPKAPTFGVPGRKMGPQAYGMICIRIAQADMQDSSSFLINIDPCHSVLQHLQSQI